MSCAAVAYTGTPTEFGRFGEFGAQWTQKGAGIDEGRKNGLRQSQAIEQLDRELFSPRIVELGGASDGDFGLLDTGQPVVQQVRHEQETVCHRQRGRTGQFHGVQLVQRVELHELDAGVIEHLAARHHREQAFRDPVGARIAVMAGRIHQRPVAAQQPEIHTPRVDADTGDLEFALAAGDGESVDDLVKQAEAIPIESGGQMDGCVRKPVEFFEFQASLFEGG